MKEAAELSTPTPDYQVIIRLYILVASGAEYEPYIPLPPEQSLC